MEGNLKTVFMGTPEYVMPTLELLGESSDLVCIYTGPDKRGGRGKKDELIPKPKEYAKRHGIECIQPNSFKDELTISKLREFGADLLIVNAYGYILPKEVLSIAKYDAVNLHASLLPLYRGASPIQSALLSGEVKTGITAQRMVERVDAGDIIHQEELEIGEDEDYISLSRRLSKLSAECLYVVLSRYETGEIGYEKQDGSKATYCKKLKKKDGEITWVSSYKELSCQIRAYKAWPKSYTYYKGKKLVIEKIKYVSDASVGESGEILKSDKEGLQIQIGDGVISIEEIQPEGKKTMDYKTFLNGNKVFLGNKLGI